MINKFRFILNQHEKQIYIAYVLIFFASIAFTFFFRRGIEFTRYGLIALTAVIFFSQPKFLKNLLNNYSFWTLFCFISIATISLIYNHASLSKIDDAINWTLFYIFGFMVFHILKANIFLIIYAIPIILFLCQIIYPTLTGELIGNINFLNGKRLDLFFGGKPIHLGIVAGISTFTAFYIFLKSNNNYIKIIYSILTFFSFIILLSTGTRTSFIGTTITISIVLFHFFHKKIRPSYLIIATLSILIILFSFTSSKNEVRISSLTDSEKVTDAFLQRELIFIIAKDSFLRSPIIGEGFDRFSEIYHGDVATHIHKKNASEKYSYILKSTNNAHNFSLHFLTETGVLGFLCMNIFWGLIIWSGLKSRNDSAKIISGVYFLSYIAFQFNMSLYGTQLSTLLFALAGLSGAAVQDSKYDGLHPDNETNFLQHELKAFK